MNMIFSAWWLLIAAAWYMLNGILHDIFVIKAHRGGYDRELLRLLMDGHVLVFSGALLAAGWWILKSGHTGGAVISLLVAVFMTIYCAMIFPFLKSFGTLAISIIVCLVSLKSIFYTA